MEMAISASQRYFRANEIQFLKFFEILASDFWKRIQFLDSFDLKNEFLKRPKFISFGFVGAKN